MSRASVRLYAKHCATDAKRSDTTTITTTNTRASVGVGVVKYHH